MSVDESGVSDIGMGLGWLHGQGIGAPTKVPIYPRLVGSIGHIMTRDGPLRRPPAALKAPQTQGSASPQTHRLCPTC